MTLKAASISFLCLVFVSGTPTDSFARPRLALIATLESFSGKDVGDRTPYQIVVPATEYQTDIDRLIARRSHSFEELISLANQLESKWRRIDWNQYARIMIYICSEIANRGLNDVSVRRQTEHFALMALSHSQMFLWEYHSSLVGWFGHERWSSTDSAWLRERRQLFPKLVLES